MLYNTFDSKLDILILLELPNHEKQIHKHIRGIWSYTHNIPMRP